MKVKSNSEIKEFLTPYAEQLNIRIYDVEFKQGKNPALTVYIDCDGGVDLNCCEKFHNLINEPLDELDPSFGVAYTLNVSSPGADRPFKTEQDFLSHIGKKVEMKLYSAIRGKKFYDCTLVSFDNENVVVKAEKETFSVSRKNIVKMNEYIEL